MSQMDSKDSDEDKIKKFWVLILKVIFHLNKKQLNLFTQNIFHEQVTILHN